MAVKRTAQKEVVDRLKKRLDNKNYITHAPGDIVKQTKEQLTEAQAKLNSIDQEYERFRLVSFNGINIPGETASSLSIDTIHVNSQLLKTRSSLQGLY